MLFGLIQRAEGKQPWWANYLINYLRQNANTWVYDSGFDDVISQIYDAVDAIKKAPASKPGTLEDLLGE